MRGRCFIYSAASLGAALVLLGCGSEDVAPDGLPELFPVRVTILQEGAPLANASVRLIPEEGTSPWNSGGSTDTNGVAVLRTHGKFEGVPAGSYKLTVSKIEMPPPPSADLSPLDALPTADQPTYDLVAPEYTLPNQTPLRLEVGAGNNRYEPFDLGPPVRLERKGPGRP